MNSAETKASTERPTGRSRQTCLHEYWSSRPHKHIRSGRIKVLEEHTSAGAQGDFSTLAIGDHDKPDIPIDTDPPCSLRGRRCYKNESHEDEEFYVQEPLVSRHFDEHGFGDHILEQHQQTDPYPDLGSRWYKWVTDGGKKVSLDQLDHAQPEELQRPSHAVTAPSCEVHEVGMDGRSQVFPCVSQLGKQSNRAIWDCLKTTPLLLERAAGRITTVQNLSPVLIGALCYTKGDTFCVGQLLFYSIIADRSLTSARSFPCESRCYDNVFTFNLSYLNLELHGGQPLPWQGCLPKHPDTRAHPRLHRCSSTVALALTGRQVANVQRTRDGAAEEVTIPVYDTFGSWEVLNVQFGTSGSAFNQNWGTRYTCGPEAFMTVVLDQIRLASFRTMLAYEVISETVSPHEDCSKLS